MSFAHATPAQQESPGFSRGADVNAVCDMRRAAHGGQNPTQGMGTPTAPVSFEPQHQALPAVSMPQVEMPPPPSATKW